MLPLIRWRNFADIVIEDTYLRKDGRMELTLHPACASFPLLSLLSFVYRLELRLGRYTLGLPWNWEDYSIAMLDRIDEYSEYKRELCLLLQDKNVQTILSDSPEKSLYHINECRLLFFPLPYKYRLSSPQFKYQVTLADELRLHIEGSGAFCLYV